MNPIDINDLAADAANIIGGLLDHTTRGPLLVEQNGEPIAVVIRHAAWAPRLHNFSFELGRRSIACHQCTPAAEILTDVTSLENALQAANQHWRETHRSAR